MMISKLGNQKLIREGPNILRTFTDFCCILKQKRVYCQSILQNCRGGRNMKFCEVEFGTSDAETELIRTPQIFDRAFFDPHNYIDELVNGFKFIVSGRKGDGKSAYCAKISRLAKSSDGLEAITVNLEHLNSKFFAKFTDEDLTGGIRYVPMWKCLILLELVKHFENRGFQIQRENYRSLVDALNRIGLLSGESIEATITTLDSTDVTLNAKNWITYGRHVERQVVIRGASDIYNALKNEINPVYLGGTKFRMIFDGLDDILRNKEINIDIITGLIRSINEVNQFFHEKTLDFKCIVLVRNDILDKCRDPDISKIKFASLINISWKIVGNPYESDLARLLLERFNMQNKEFEDFKTAWVKYFPSTIDDKDSFPYMLENTLYKPRDFLMFFVLAKKYIGSNDRRLTEYDFKQLLSDYSVEYFMTHMQDELTGFLPDASIYELNAVISKIGSRRFTFEAFEDEMKKHNAFDGVAAETVLGLLFERGYIGQYRKRPDHPKEEFLFQVHINPKETYEKEDDCMIHRGLIRAFGI